MIDAVLVEFEVIDILPLKTEIVVGVNATVNVCEFPAAILPEEGVTLKPSGVVIFEIEISSVPVLVTVNVSSAVFVTSTFPKLKVVSDNSVVKVFVAISPESEEEQAPIINSTDRNARVSA